MRFSDLVTSNNPEIIVRDGPRLGIELEYEGGSAALRDFDMAGWSVLEDTSLRNHGIEYVSHITLPKHLDARLRAAEEKVKKYNLIPHKRCGVHVHLNVTDMTMQELWSLSAMYFLLEMHIFNHFAPNRSDNHFCVPLIYCDAIADAFLRDTYTLWKPEPNTKKNPTPEDDAILLGVDHHQAINNYIQGALGGINKDRYMYYTRACAKYNALNYRCIREHGTIEFRHLDATTDFSLIKRWCEFILALREESMIYNSPEEVLDDYNYRGIEHLATSVGIPAATISEEDKADAEYCAAVLCGAKPAKPDSLQWKIGA